MTDFLALLRAEASRAAPRGERARHLAELIREQFGRRWVGLYEVTADEVVNLAWSGPTAPAHPRFPRGSGLTGAAIAERRTIVSNDVANDPRYLTALESTGSELIVPIVVDDAVCGTLDVEDARTDAFSDVDLAQLEAVARELGPLYR
jgi:GAF domain-containing protein